MKYQTGSAADTSDDCNDDEATYHIAVQPKQLRNPVESKGSVHNKLLLTILSGNPKLWVSVTFSAQF